ncbi:MAG TPA: TatD family hydrolase [Gammaproteobacteria bacterium]|nr:TatD family hydrolase [Gammaproteobacteria bacterium]
MMIDSHCHLDQLDLTPYNGDLSCALRFAEDQGVKHFLCVCITLKDFPHMMEIIQPYKNVSASLGLHPNEEVEHEPCVEDFIQLAQDKKIIAIGETGLDYYRSAGDLEWQRERFRHHIRAAQALGKPLIVHSRQAKEDTLKILREENAASIGGILHCFTEDMEMARKAMDLNFYISFSGIVTFNNAKEIQTVAREMPLERMLIETDSPYLAPVPFRGKSNQPAYVRYVAECIAKLRNVEVELIAEQTTANFFKLFNGIA